MNVGELIDVLKTKDLAALVVIADGFDTDFEDIQVGERDIVAGANARVRHSPGVDRHLWRYYTPTEIGMGKHRHAHDESMGKETAILIQRDGARK